MNDFSELKAEQIERIKQRDSFVNLSIVSTGIMISAAFAGDVVRSQIMLALPWVSMAFGWSFVLNDVKISRFSNFFKTSSSSEGPQDGWEIWRRNRKRTWLENPLTGAMVQFLIFICPGLVSLLVYFVVRPDRKIENWEIISCSAGVLLLVLLGCAIGTAARIRVSNT